MKNYKTIKHLMKANASILPSQKSVTSVRLADLNRLSNVLTRLLPKLFHFKQNCCCGSITRLLRALAKACLFYSIANIIVYPETKYTRSVANNSLKVPSNGGFTQLKWVTGFRIRRTIAQVLKTTFTKVNRSVFGVYRTYK